MLEQGRNKMLAQISVHDTNKYLLQNFIDEMTASLSTKLCTGHTEQQVGDRGSQASAFEVAHSPSADL